MYTIIGLYTIVLIVYNDTILMHSGALRRLHPGKLLNAVFRVVRRFTAFRVLVYYRLKRGIQAR